MKGKNMDHNELTLPIVEKRNYYARGFYTHERHDGWYATQCMSDGNTPLTANQIGPCVSEKQSVFLYMRHFSK